MNSELTEIKKLVNQVQNFAEKNKFSYLIPEQMLFILLDDEKCVKLIKTLTTDFNKKETIKLLKAEVFSYINDSVEKTKDISDINPTNAYTKLIQSSISSGVLRSIEPDSLCVFMMLFSDKTQASSYFLYKHGIDENKVHKYIADYRINESGNGEKPFLQKFATNLTELAKSGKIDPLIGRENEVKRIIQILAKKRSSCPILVGESGTGKSAVVEGLALKIANDEVPESIANKKIYTINLTSMVAGTRFRGEFEERLENTIKEVSKDNNILLFIDEIHTIVGSGSAEGSLDSANILKPYLSNGSIHLIGATTYEEYKNKIEKDKALCRRFKKIDLCEPSKEETLKILQGLKPKYEEFHKVKFDDEVLKYIVDLSGRFLIGKYFPDKAIDVMDEIGAKYHSGLKKGEEANREDVEEVICSMANIPKLSLETNDKEKLKDLDARIKKNLYGQDEIVDKLVRQVRMSKAGLANIGKPILNAMFVGPTAVGKTELAKTLAKELGIGFTKLDMSEYQEEYSVSKLIGSAPGYVGYEQSGALTEPVIKNPNQVILLDEIEKANKTVYDLLLQVMDEGKLTDNHGREASFKNAIILMTSNVGCANADQMKTQLGFTKSSTNEIKRKNDAIKNAFEKTFSPEFRNRLTDVFYFNPMNKEILGMIVDKNIRRLQDLLKDKNIQISITDKAREYFVNKASEENAGGRPVERLINNEVTEKISDEILFGKLSDEKGGKVSVGMNNDKVVVKVIESHE